MRASFLFAAGMVFWVFGTAELWSQTGVTTNADESQKTTVSPAIPVALSNSLTPVSISGVSRGYRATNVLSLVPEATPLTLRDPSDGLEFVPRSLSPTNMASVVADGLTADTAKSADAASLFREPKANELNFDHFVLSGILVEAKKTRRPWQLFNPFASKDYGTVEDNLLKDPANGSITGLKVFSLRF